MLKQFLDDLNRCLTTHLRKKSAKFVYNFTGDSHWEIDCNLYAKVNNTFSFPNYAYF